MDSRPPLLQQNAIGHCRTNYSPDIDLHPGYQRLQRPGPSRTSATGIRTLGHLPDGAQQRFVKALKEQVQRTLSPLGLPGLIDTVTKNVGEGRYQRRRDQRQDDPLLHAVRVRTAVRPLLPGADREPPALRLGGAELIAVNSRRPAAVVEQPTATLVRASGKCAECHSEQQYSVVHEFELSVHAQKHINCLNCHGVAPGQQGKSHHDFEITTQVTSANCRSCHEPIYQQFLRSRHAAPSWAAVYGDEPLTMSKSRFAEKFHPHGGQAARQSADRVGRKGGDDSGCVSCHSIGKPNADGTIGSCTACHAPHVQPSNYRPSADDLRSVPHGARPLTT